MDNEIVISKLDYSRLNSMILNLLDISDSNLFELNSLNSVIKQAILVEPKKISPDYITMNSVVEVVFSKTGKSSILKLVYPGNANLKNGSLSVLSQLGCSLLGARIGQTVSFQTPGGSRTVIIKNILYQPEANGVDMK